MRKKNVRRFVFILTIILILIMSGSPSHAGTSDGYWLLIHTEAIIPDDNVSSDGSYEKYYDDSDGRIEFRRIKNFTSSSGNQRDILEVEGTWSRPPEVVLGDDSITLNATVKINEFQKVNTNYSGIELWMHWTLPSVKIGTAGSDAALSDANGIKTLKASVVDGVIAKDFDHKTLSRKISAGNGGDQRVLNVVVNADGILGYRYTYEWTLGDPAQRFSYGDLLNYLKNEQNRNEMRNTLRVSNQFTVNAVNGDYRARTREVTFDELKNCFHSDVRFFMILRGIMPTPKTFTDVPESNWASPFISRASSYGFVSGTGDGKYSPQSSVTRAQFIAMVMNVIGAEHSASAPSTYSDVKPGDWYYDVVVAAKEKGILNYLDVAAFTPNQQLTREEMSAILSGVLTAESITPVSTKAQISSAFGDAAIISNAFRESVQRVYDIGLMGGKGQGRFDPKGLTTRAEAAAVQLKVMEALFDILPIHEN